MVVRNRVLSHIADQELKRTKNWLSNGNRSNEPGTMRVGAPLKIKTQVLQNVLQMLFRMSLFSQCLENHKTDPVGLKNSILKGNVEKKPKTHTVPKTEKFLEKERKDTLNYDFKL